MTSWPSLSAAETVAKLRASGTVTDVEPAFDSHDDGTRELRWMAIRVLTLERSLRAMVESNEAILESLERCFSEIGHQEDRLSPRIERLEADAVELASQLAATKHDVLSGRLEYQDETSRYDGRFAEVLELAHDAKLLAAQAHVSVEVTANKADDLIIDLRGIEATLEATVGTAEVLVERSELARQDADVSRDLADRVAELTQDVDHLSTAVFLLGEVSDQSLLAKRVEKVESRVDRAQVAARRELDALVDEVHAARELAKEADTTAQKAKDRADYAATSGDELRADFDVESREVRVELEVGSERIDRALESMKLDSLKSEIRESLATLTRLVSEDLDVDIEASEPGVDDRYLDRWARHLRVHRELQQQRAENPHFGRQ